MANYDATAQAVPPKSTNNASEPVKAYTSADVLNAAKISLIHRGNGTGPDADAGWGKVWRAACWAQFADADAFYHQLTVSASKIYFLSIKQADGDDLFSIQSSATSRKIYSASTILSTQIPSFR